MSTPALIKNAKLLIAGGKIVTNDTGCTAGGGSTPPNCYGHYDSYSRKYIYQPTATASFTIENLDLSAGGLGTQTVTAADITLHLGSGWEYFPLTVGTDPGTDILFAIVLGAMDSGVTVGGSGGVDDDFGKMNWRGMFWGMTIHFYLKNEDGSPGTEIATAYAYNSDAGASDPIKTGILEDTNDDDYYYDSPGGFGQIVKWFTGIDGDTYIYKSGYASLTLANCWCNFGASFHVGAIRRTRGKYDATTYPYVDEGYYAQLSRVDSERTITVDLTLKEDETPENTHPSGLNGTYTLTRQLHETAGVPWFDEGNWASWDFNNPPNGGLPGDFPLSGGGWPDGTYAMGSGASGGLYYIWKVVSDTVVETFASEDIWWRNGGRGSDETFTAGTWEPYTMDGHTPGRTDELWGNYSGAVYGNSTTPLKSIQSGTITIGWNEGATQSAAEQLPGSLLITVENWETGSAVIVYEGIFKKQFDTYDSGDTINRTDYSEWDPGTEEFTGSGGLIPWYAGNHTETNTGQYVAFWNLGVTTDDGPINVSICNKTGTNQGPALSSWAYPFTTKYKVKVIPGA